MFAWNEQQGVTLASPLRTDIQTPGLYDQTADLNTATLPAGTVVDSHMFHSDRPGVNGGFSGTILRQFTVTFPTDIVAIIATDGKLTDSDVLGAPGTVYGGTGRSIGFGVDSGRDQLELLADQRTIIATIRTTTSLDQFRVLTRHDASADGVGRRSVRRVGGRTGHALGERDRSRRRHVEPGMVGHLDRRPRHHVRAHRRQRASARPSPARTTRSSRPHSR